MRRFQGAFGLGWEERLLFLFVDSQISQKLGPLLRIPPSNTLCRMGSWLEGSSIAFTTNKMLGEQPRSETWG